MLGILGATGNISLPPDLLILTNPMVIVIKNNILSQEVAIGE